MSTSRAAVARVWWAVLALVAALSVWVDLFAFVRTNAGVAGATVFSNQASGAEAAGAWAWALRHASFFTMQSNLLVAAAALPLALDPRHDSYLWRGVRLASLLGITITAVVFVAVLAPIYRPEGIAQWTNIGLHYLSPIMALGGWVLFGPWGRTGGAAWVPSVVWVALWTAWTFAHGAASGWYPYPFIDVAVLGYAAALGNVAVILVGGIVLLLAVRGLDAWLARRTASGAARAVSDRSS